MSSKPTTSKRENDELTPDPLAGASGIQSEEKSVVNRYKTIIVRSPYRDLFLRAKNFIWYYWTILRTEAYICTLWQHDQATYLVFIDERGYPCKIRVGSGNFVKGTFKELRVYRRPW